MKSLLIANRGEIALRIMRTARRMGIRTIAVYSDADAQAPHVRAADAAVRIGPASPRGSYLNIPVIVDAAQRADADAIHPGYGFLAENADFAQAVIDAKLTWIGPPPAVIRQMGDKAAAKRIAHDAGVPTIPGIELDAAGNAPARPAGVRIDYPLMIKAAAGGGGRGMRLVQDASALAAAIDTARSEAENAFGDGRLLVEQALSDARHIEVQVFADQHGNVVHLGERDCSVQRRHQKLIEESPSPAVDAMLREQIGGAAVALAKAVDYVGAGTVEFLLDDRSFYFMEMNTRLQVEHPVTEAITGTDLVEWQIRVARGEPFTRKQDDIRLSGHAIEARLCAENGEFLPQSGTLALWQPGDGVRTDHALESGIEISPYYDSMIAKVIARGATRDEAREKLARALDRTVALGLPTNKAFLARVLRSEEFARGPTTEFIAHFSVPVRQKPDAEMAIAAALLAASASYGEWNGWSSNPARAMRAKFGDVDVALTQSGGEYRADVGGVEIALRILDLSAPRARIAIDGVDETITFAIDGEAIHLAHRGESYTFENTIHAPAARAAGGSDGRLIAPMNGRVVAVNAEPGDTAEAGRALIVLEAMKMEHTLSVPTIMRVTAVHVTPGAQVKPGQLLAELEAP